MSNTANIKYRHGGLVEGDAPDTLLIRGPDRDGDYSVTFDAEGDDAQFSYIDTQGLRATLAGLRWLLEGDNIEREFK